MNMDEAIKSMELYRDNRVPTGGFLEACLSNDLREAFGRADESSRNNLFEIVKYLYNEMPSDIWGSREAVKAHLDKGMIQLTNR